MFSENNIFLGYDNVTENIKRMLHFITLANILVKLQINVLWTIKNEWILTFKYSSISDE